MIRNLKFIAPLSTAANISMAIGLGIILTYCLADLPPLASRTAVAHWSQIPLFFGTAIYAFEGISLVSIYSYSRLLNRNSYIAGWARVYKYGIWTVFVFVRRCYRYNWKWKIPIGSRPLWVCWTWAWLSWRSSYWPWALWVSGDSAMMSKAVLHSTCHPL